MKAITMLLLAMLLIGCADLGDPVSPVTEPTPKIVLDDLHGDSWYSGVVVCTAPDLGVPFHAHVEIFGDTLQGSLMRYRGGWRFGCVLPDKLIWRFKIIGTWDTVPAVSDTLVLTRWE